MYKVDVDTTKKLIKLQISGFVNISEMNSFVSEFQSALKKFKPKEVLVLGDMSDFKPASPDVVPVMQKVLAEGVAHCKKVAAIHKNVIAQMQLKRIGEEVQANEVIKRFRTEEEALKYLYE